MNALFNFKNNSNLLLRVLSASVLVAIVLLCFSLGSLAMTTLLVVSGCLMFGEWVRLVLKAPFCRFDFKTFAFFLSGSVYIALAVFALYNLIFLLDSRQLFYILLVIWMSDSFAYLCGRMFGKHKFAPKISPSKTWEGFLGGVLCASLLGAVFLTFFAIPFWKSPLFFVHVLLNLFAIAVPSQLGDLLESFAKRMCGQKDSSNLIPGHGGVLDRLDSLLFVSIILWLIYFV